ncbi:tail fiber domain-containing protein [Winogradskyella psychrotolerans]|uniref:tail fiber domain-containing protein n=1 Tax=Winogradskyella psychrotolerans TaxID=1344585 RepID=UPI001C066820|nr:tail fiber domain-containing protein [Winogradskyella psychrotolerans]MBU2930138.1 tail fiber domain-containing protein [Winogradskyella psychrotolerans]
MKKIIIALVVTLLATVSSFAQQGINYKALIKDDLGNVLTIQTIGVQFQIREATANGSAVYTETHTSTTDANGILILNIGKGSTTDLFNTIDWSSNAHWLNLQIDITGGTNYTDISTTQFMAVPYALSAENVSGLEKITENDGTEDKTGWRLVGQDPANYGPIGKDATDLSYSHVTSSQKGAIGNYSTAMGYNTIASGDRSTAMGYYATASGKNSIAAGEDSRAIGDGSTAIGNSNYAIGEGATSIGFGTVAAGDYSTAFGISTQALGISSTSLGALTIAESYYSTAIGRNNVAGGDPTTWIPTDPLFEIGNSSSNISSNALTVLKNGEVITGGPLSIQNSSDATSTWRLETRPNGSLSMYRNGSYRGFFSESTGNYSSISDRSTKKDITALENGTLHKVMQLNPVSYLMKDQIDTKRNLGLISQEVQKIFPSITNYVEEADLITLSYTELIPILIKALQEQQGIINEQSDLIETITADNSLLKAKDVVQDKSIEALLTRLNLIESKSTH